MLWATCGTPMPTPRAHVLAHTRAHGSTLPAGPLRGQADLIVKNFIVFSPYVNRSAQNPSLQTHGREACYQVSAQRPAGGGQ